MSLNRNHTENQPRTVSGTALLRFVFQDWQSNKDHTVARAAMVTYRIGHLAQRADVQPSLATPLRIIFRLFRMLFWRILDSGDIDPQAEIGPRLVLPHGLSGVFINGQCRIGADVVVCQQVSLGVRDMMGQGAPTIGDEVVVWAGAKVVGGVTVGDRAAIGANSVVTSDVPADTLAVGIPARHSGSSTEDAAAFKREQA
jgi:serine O-acetyltransferase